MVSLPHSFQIFPIFLPYKVTKSETMLYNKQKTKKKKKTQTKRYETKVYKNIN